MLYKIALIYFIVISLFSVIITVFDKLAAIRGKRRISERALMLFAFFGGAASMYATMRIIRHKTRHNRFMIGLPIIIVLQMVAVFTLRYLFC